jgi:glutathione synthase/RimK-type ligase-like ATP-grasp enzyme
MNSIPILIIAEPGDTHALVVATRLEQKYSCKTIIWDSSRFPATEKISHNIDDCFCSSYMVSDAKAIGNICISDLGAIWWRRPHPSRISESVIEPTMRAYCRNESGSFFYGLIESLDVPIFNNPNKEQKANMKAFQLKCAVSVGLKIPSTLMTNNPEHVKSFYKQHSGKVIFKMFSSLPGQAVSTRRLELEHFEKLFLLENAPVLFQEEIPTNLNIRITIVGDKIFAGESSSEFLDWRIDSDLIWKKHILPGHIEKRIKNLMSLLDLQFGSIDMRVVSNGDYIFLEINPNGQFLFLEIDDETLKISNAFADFLYTAAKTKIVS